MNYLFNPKNPGELASVSRGSETAMRKGETHDVSTEWAARLNALIEGDGGPALVPVAQEAAQEAAPAPKAKGRPKAEAPAPTPADPAVELT